ncbi:flagellar basal-body rod protein FlgB [Rhodobium orientis]|uniref:Flagellar basal body rod protein FlgB n=1 Tax=Rhodobium orientis TaxID=34017 RepID=A0A327JGY3_9HYPH|nr:flagellar basal body rod protein FlgB [Rhodobium orientis]MBB4301811.1 flagellar basal-body rod protein FlgB [Rhodobium orientis]MBK5950609.1 flagellar basal-body rod protein FlgB [Rhodobium orientis]RAI24554.1 flagellar basal body rod protein FlgB [Rhodobium orientis]
MAFTDLRLFQALRTKMHWHQVRQGVLAENIANADTPDFEGKDLKKISFDRALVQTQPGIGAALTHPMHIPVSPGDPRFSEKDDEFQLTPNGNGVTLEEEMMKITSNQMDYQTATTLYSRGLGILKLAVRNR